MILLLAALWMSPHPRLEDIESFIAQENATAAKETVAVILASARQLQTAPLSGRQVSDYRFHNLRELLERPYRIIYRVKNDSGEVLTVMHYRQHLPRKSTHLHQRSK